MPDKINYRKEIKKLKEEEKQLIAKLDNLSDLNVFIDSLRDNVNSYVKELDEANAIQASLGLLAMYNSMLKALQEAFLKK